MNEEELVKLFGRSWIRLKILAELAKFNELTIDEVYRLLGKEKKRYQYLMNHLKLLQELGILRIIDNYKVQLTAKGRKYTQKVAALFKNCTDSTTNNNSLEVYLAGHYKAWASLKLLLEFIRDFNHLIPQVLYKYINGFPLLASIGVYWRDKFKIPHNLIKRESISKLFVDSGAQQFFSKFKSAYYPYTPCEYIRTSLSILNADLIATLDLPLDILVSRGIISISHGIRKTVEYGVDCIEVFEKEVMESTKKPIVVPVLQGFDDPSQWLECYDIYKEQGIDKNKFKIWGVGSLCITRSYKFASKVLHEIRHHIGHDVKLHVFGLGLHIVRKVYNIINSYDTSSWVYWAKMDGAYFAFFPKRTENSWRLRFMQWTTRTSHKYDTVEIMALNALNVLLHNEVLNLMKHKKK